MMQGLNRFMKNYCTPMDPVVNKYLYQELWIASYAGLGVVFMAENNWYIGVTIYIFYWAVLLFQEYMFSMSVITSDFSNVAVLIQQIHLWIIEIICMTMITNMIYVRHLVFINVRKLWKELLELIHNEPFLKDLEKHRIRDKRIILITVASYITLIVAVVMAAPILDRLSKPPEDGFFLPLPFNTWTPFKIDSYLKYSFILAVQVGAASCTCGVLVFNIAFFCLIMQYYLLHIKALIIQLDNVSKMKTETVDDIRIIEKKLKKIFLHHQEIIVTFAKIKTVVKTPILCAFLSAQVVIALGLVHIVSEGGGTGEKTASAITVVGEMYFVYIVSYLGDDLKSLGEEFRFQLYNLPWRKYPRCLVSSIAIAQVGSMPPLSINVYNIVSVELATFAATMNAAYSFTNLIFAMK